MTKQTSAIDRVAKAIKLERHQEIKKFDHHRNLGNIDQIMIDAQYLQSLIDCIEGKKDPATCKIICAEARKLIEQCSDGIKRKPYNRSI